MAFLNDRDWLLAHVRYTKEDDGKLKEMMKCFKEARFRSEKILNALGGGDESELRRKWPQMKKNPTVVECLEMFCLSLTRYACEVLPYESHLIAAASVAPPKNDVRYAETPAHEAPSQREAVECLRRVLNLAEIMGDSDLMCKTLVLLADWHETRIAKWHGDSTIADKAEAKRLRIHLTQVQQEMGSRVETDCPICLECLEAEDDEPSGGSSSAAASTSTQPPQSSASDSNLNAGHTLADLSSEGDLAVLNTQLNKTEGVFVLSDCYHRFHVYCLDKYHLELGKKNALMLKCPLCRTTI